MHGGTILPVSLPLTTTSLFFLVWSLSSIRDDVINSVNFINLINNITMSLVPQNNVTTTAAFGTMAVRNQGGILLKQCASH